MKNQELPTKKGGGSGRCYICSEEHLAHRHCGLCKSLEHRTRDCEERGAEKGAMLAKLTVPAVPEVRAVAAMVGATRGDRKEEWELDSGATFHMSHTRTGMSAYKKASPGVTVEIATVTFYRWTGSEESRWIWTNRVAQPRW